MLHQLVLPPDVWRQTLTVATAFWAVCLLLMIIDAVFGGNAVTGTLFFLSLPALVGFLVWANKDLLVLMSRGLMVSMAVGLYMLTAASLIVFVGLFAAANLKSQITGA